MHLTNPGPGLQDQVWVWLAGEDIKDQESAMDYCRNFLIYFVKTSTKPQLVWGPEEQRDEQGLTTVTSVNTTWKSLIAAAQEQVLDRMASKTGRQLYLARRQGPAGAADTGPVARITQVSPPQDPQLQIVRVGDVRP